MEQRKPSAKHRGWSREWSISPVRLLAGDPVQAQLEDGTWVSGTLHPVRGGLEIEYEEARAAGQGCVESSRLLDHEAARRLRMLVRPEPLWTDSVRVRRETQIWQAAHPPWHVRLGQWTRELCRRDPLAAEPLLRRHLGRRVIVDVRRGPRTLFAAGVLLAYDRVSLDPARPSMLFVASAMGELAVMQDQAWRVDTFFQQLQYMLRELFPPQD